MSKYKVGDKVLLIKEPLPNIYYYKCMLDMLGTVVEITELVDNEYRTTGGSDEYCWMEREIVGKVVGNRLVRNG